MKDKNDAKVDAYTDSIKYGEDGWKERYYAEKFHVRGKSEFKEF